MKDIKKIMAAVLTAALCVAGSGTVWAADDITVTTDGQVISSNYGNVSVSSNISCTIEGNASVLSITGGSVGSTIRIKGGEVTHDVYGGRAGDGSATGNRVEISGGRIGNNVIGGLSTTGDASGNTVRITGGTITGNVYGGQSTNRDATNNTVEICCPITLTSIMGGLSETGQSSGNILHIASKNISAGGVEHFQSLRFTLPSNIAPGDTLLTLPDGEHFSGMDIDTTNFELAPGVRLNRGDKITLVRNFGDTVGTITGSTYKSSEGEGKGHASLEGSDLVYTIDEVPTKEEAKEERSYDRDISSSSSNDEPVSKYTLKTTENASPITFTQGGNITATITTTAGGGNPFDHFTQAQLNGVRLVRNRHFRIERGSLIITLLPEALVDLPEGTNYLTVFFDDGDINIPFNPADLPKAAPKTGEV